MRLSKRTNRQLKNLESTCTFDTENQVAFVPLHYETPEDLLDIHMSWPETPVISDEAIDYLRDVISAIPEAFSIEISLTVDDYGEYNHDQLLDALRATIENTYYYHDEKRRDSNILSIFFLIVGFLALAIEVIGGFAGWLGAKDTVGRIILETLLDVMTWVFLWEGCALLLLTYENESTLFSQEMNRFHAIRFRAEDGTVLNSLEEKDFYDSWIHIGPKEAFCRCFLLLFSAVIPATIIVQVLRLLSGTGSMTGPQILFQIVSWVLLLILVCCNVSFYLDIGDLKKHAFSFSVAAFVFHVLYVFYCAAHFPGTTLELVLNCVVILSLLLNGICIRYMNKQSIEI